LVDRRESVEHEGGTRFTTGQRTCFLLNSEKPKIRNSKHETRNNTEDQNSKDENADILAKMLFSVIPAQAGIQLF
jgi:hypothetical protein